VGQDGVVQLRLLTLDRAVGNRWLVTSGLQAGELVIVEGSQRARPGTTVKTVPFAEDKATPAGTNATTVQPATAN
jgi:membrane fusion protein (multidrug efflux system)